MRKILSCLLVTVLLASMVPVAVMAVGAQQAGIPCDDGDNKLTREELADAILPYMISEGDLKLDDVGDAAWVYAYWNGMPKPITDSLGYKTTIYRPVERLIAVGGSYGPEATLALGAKDKLVGVANYAKTRAELEPLLDDVPGVGSSTKPDAEAILALKPDLVQGYACFDLASLRDVLKDAGIPLVQLDFSKVDKYIGEIETFGIILDKEEKADGLISFEQQYRDLIAKRVENLEPEQKPRVYMESYDAYKAAGSGTADHDILLYCGGINIYNDTEGDHVIAAEDVVKRNPQVIIKDVSKSSLPESGYGVTDTGPMEELRNDIMYERPAWDTTDAVKNGSVYILSTDAKSIHGCVYYSYIARMLHPDLFEDIDPVDVHSDWFERFLGIEFTGVYAYPTSPVPWR